MTKENNRKKYTLEEIKEILKGLSSKTPEEVSRETGRSVIRLNFIKDYYNYCKKTGKIYPTAKKIGLLIKKAGKELNIPFPSVSLADSTIGETDSYQKLDHLFNNFKENLVNILVVIVKDLSREEIEKNKKDYEEKLTNATDCAYRKGKAEGAIEVQTQFIEEGKKSNIAEMLRKRLLGGAR